MTAIEGTKAVTSANLVGVVSGYVPYQDIAVSQQTGRPRIIFEENSGLATIVPAERVIELVAQVEATIKPKEPSTPAEPEQEAV
jgi:hypothetical protein